MRAGGGSQSHYRLYSAAAALILHRCDLQRVAASNDPQRPVAGTCVGALNDLVERGYNAHDLLPASNTSLHRGCFCLDGAPFSRPVLRLAFQPRMAGDKITA